MKLSLRLEKCLSYTKGFSILADVGTDHAFLPIESVLRGYVNKAYAIDNKVGPYKIASENIKKHHLQDKVVPLFSDGLVNDNIEDVEVVVIAGMGGETISKILKNAKLTNIKRLILQPNRDAYLLRKTITSLDFKIIDELVIQETPRYYDIIVAESGKEKYLEIELKYGPLLIKSKPQYFIKRLLEHKNKLETVLENVNDKSKRNDINQILDEIKEILDER